MSLRRVVVLVLAVLLVSGCEFRGMQDLPLPGSPDVADESYAVTAEFTDVLSLGTAGTPR